MLHPQVIFQAYQILVLGLWSINVLVADLLQNTWNLKNTILFFFVLITIIIIIIIII
jgi:hypothetical protein